MQQPRIFEPRFARIAWRDSYLQMLSPASERVSFIMVEATLTLILIILGVYLLGLYLAIKLWRMKHRKPTGRSERMSPDD